MVEEGAPPVDDKAELRVESAEENRDDVDERSEWCEVVGGSEGDELRNDQRRSRARGESYRRTLARRDLSPYPKSS